MAVESVNEALMNFLLKRSHYIQRYENGTITEVMAPYHRAKQQLAESVMRLEDYGTGYTLQYRIDRLNSQMAEIDAVLSTATAEGINNLQENLSHFAYDHKEVYEDLLDTKFGEIGINITRIPFEHVDRMLSSPLGMQGADWQARFENRYGQQLVRIKEELSQSMILGEDMAKASRRLWGQGALMTGTVGRSLQDTAKVITRTEIMRTQNIVNKAIYDENIDVIKGLEFCAVLDDRTCIVCGSRDGKIYYYNQNPPGPFDTPPLHPLCRCVFCPLTKSWRELGVNADEVPQGTRAAFDGQVPASLSYDQWLRAMDAADPDFVKDILGKRYKYWQTGQLSLKKMVSDNRIIPLEELKKITKEKLLKKGLPLVAAEMPTWKIADLINDITLGDFLKAVRNGETSKVSSYFDDIISHQPLSVVQHNLNDVNVMRYMYERGMSTNQMHGFLGDYSKMSRAKLYKGGIPVQPTAPELQAKMTARQIAARKNKWIKTKQHHSIADNTELEIADGLGADHVIGNTPFDVFLNNEFIEVKTMLNNTSGLKGQISMHVEAIPRKRAFVKKYGVRGHTVAIDKTPGSETFGKIFYREGFKKYRLENMIEVKDYDHLKQLLKKGAKEPPTIASVKAKVPKLNTLKKNENWAKKNLRLVEADYDELDNDVANLFNSYLKGAADELQVKPVAVRFDERLFLGKNANVTALSFEDGTLAFNPKFFQHMDDLKLFMKEQNDIGQFVTASRGHVFRHELGHLRYFQMGGTEATATRKLSKKHLGMLSKDVGKSNMPRYLSKYSLKNEGEFYAEMMSRKLAGERLHPVTIRILNNIEKSIKKLKVKKRRK